MPRITVMPAVNRRWIVANEVDPERPAPTPRDVKGPSLS